jgi:protein-S-isoprenylcysteine O-methyltransferase Ste14
MLWNTLTADAAYQWAVRLWALLMIVWVVLLFRMKRAKKREGWGERAQHGILVILGFWLLFRTPGNGGWLNYRVIPDVPESWTAGLLLTVVGIGISIWARLILGSNWSGMVTLKSDHVLVRKGPYRWIRHPIYTGILLGMVGAAFIRGHLRGFIGVVLVFAAFYIKARREERFLKDEFGPGFEEHLRRTGMFLPKMT